VNECYRVLNVSLVEMHAWQGMIKQKHSETPRKSDKH